MKIPIDFLSTVRSDCVGKVLILPRTQNMNIWWKVSVIIFYCDEDLNVEICSFQQPRGMDWSIKDFRDDNWHSLWTGSRCLFSERYSVMVSTFVPVTLTRGILYTYLQLGEYLDDVTQAEPTLLYDDFTSPREQKQNPGKAYSSFD